MHNKRIDNIPQVVIAIVFLVLLSVGFFQNFLLAHAALFQYWKTPDIQFDTNFVAKTEELINVYLYKKSTLIDVYGGVQKLLMKNEVGNFDVVKDQEGFLHQRYASISNETLDEYADNLNSIYEFCCNNNIPFVYFQAPSDIYRGKTHLPIGITYSSNEEIDYFLENVNGYGIPYIDGRMLFQEDSIDNIFFRTDHHWLPTSGFKASQKVVEYFNSTYGFNLDPDHVYMNPESYSLETYPNSFLGSYGIRTGKYYIGKEDFSLLIPNFETDLTLNHYFMGELNIDHSGTYQEAFIDQGILNSTTYNNKYNALLFGSNVEAYIKNHLADNDLKCLVIADSFGRSFVQHISLCFAQTAYIDPQPGRYNESFSEFCKNYQPDVVIVLINGRSIYFPITL